MKQKNFSKIKNFKPSVPEEVLKDPEFQKEIDKFIKASLSVYKLDDDF